MKYTKTAKIEFGNVELPATEFDAKNVKQRITTYIDKDVLEGLKAMAEKSGEGYQTLMNKILRQFVTSEGKLLTENDLSLLFKRNAEISARVEAIEARTAAMQAMAEILQNSRIPKGKKKRA